VLPVPDSSEEPFLEIHPGPGCPIWNVPTPSGNEPLLAGLAKENGRPILRASSMTRFAATATQKPLPQLIESRAEVKLLKGAPRSGIRTVADAIAAGE